MVIGDLQVLDLQVSFNIHFQYCFSSSTACSKVEYNLFKIEEQNDFFSGNTDTQLKASTIIFISDIIRKAAWLNKYLHSIQCCFVKKNLAQLRVSELTLIYCCLLMCNV